MEYNIAALAGCVCVAFGTLLDVVGVATHEWAVANGPLGRATIRFDRDCDKGSCLSTDQYERDLQAIRVLVPVGLGCCLVTLLVASAFLEIRRRRLFRSRMLPTVAFLFCNAAGFTTVVGVTLFGVKLRSMDEFSLGYSFFLCLVAGFFVLMGGYTYHYAVLKEMRPFGNGDNGRHQHFSYPQSHQHQESVHLQPDQQGNNGSDQNNHHERTPSTKRRPPEHHHHHHHHRKPSQRHHHDDKDQENEALTTQDHQDGEQQSNDQQEHHQEKDQECNSQQHQGGEDQPCNNHQKQADDSQQDDTTDQNSDPAAIDVTSTETV